MQLFYGYFEKHHLDIKHKPAFLLVLLFFKAYYWSVALSLKAQCYYYC